MKRDVYYYIFIKAGSIYEPKKLRGISHFLEHILFNYSFNRYGLNNFLDENSIDKSFETSRYATSGNFWVLNKKLLKELKEKLNIILKKPTISPESISQEKKIIKEEINYKKQLPSVIASNEFYKFIFKGTPLENAFIDPIKSLPNFTENTLKKWHRKLYRPQNIIELIYHPNSKKIKISRKKIAKPQPIKLTKKSGFKKTKYGMPSKIIDIGWYIKNPTLKEKFCMDILRRIVGAMGQSFIFSHLVQKKHLVYEGTAYLDHYSGLSLLNLQMFSTKPKNCLKELNNYKNNLMRGKLDEKIFNSAKKIEIDYYKIPDISAPYIIGKEFLSTGELILSKERIKVLKNIKFEEFLEFIKKVFSNGEFISIIE